MKNNAYASTDPLSKNKNIYNFLVPNQYHRLKSITKPTPLLSLPYTKSLGVFADMCSYTGLHDNSDISFFLIFPWPILSSGSQPLAIFFQFFFPHQIYIPPLIPRKHFIFTFSRYWKIPASISVLSQGFRMGEKYRGIFLIISE